MAAAISSRVLGRLLFKELVNAFDRPVGLFEQSERSLKPGDFTRKVCQVTEVGISRIVNDRSHSDVQSATKELLGVGVAARFYGDGGQALQPGGQVNAIVRGIGIFFDELFQFSYDPLVE